MQTLGNLTSLWRYPVKSMGGEELPSALITFTGLLGDRVCALLGLARAPNKPWLTARQRPALVQYHASFGDRLPADFTHPELAVQALRIRAPDGSTFTPEQPAFRAHMEQAMGCEVRVRVSERNMVDAQPLSLIGNATVAALAAEIGLGLDPLRFRANCYVDWHDGAPFLEDGLVGADLGIGEQVQIRITKRDKRCKVIGVDPTDAIVDPRVLDTVVERHEACAGVYAAVLREGVVRKGDTITLLAVVR